MERYEYVEEEKGDEYKVNGKEDNEEKKNDKREDADKDRFLDVGVCVLGGGRLGWRCRRGIVKILLEK